MAEYLRGGGGAGEVAQTLRDLAVPHFGHELVKAALEVKGAFMWGVCSCAVVVCVVACSWSVACAPLIA